MLARIGLAIGALVLPALSQTVQLVSQSTGGVQDSGDSRAPRTSADGSWIPSKDEVSAPVAGGTDTLGDSFLHRTDGTTWYVDASAPPGGDGSQSHPFNTIQAGVSNPQLGDGDLILVGPGTYAEHIVLPAVSVRILGTSGAEATIIDAEATGCAVAAPQWGPPRSITLENLTIRSGVGTYPSVYGQILGGGIFVRGNARLNCVRCAIEQCADWAVYVESSAAQLEGCKFTANNGNIYADGESSYPPYRCEIVNSSFTGGGGVGASGADLSVEFSAFNDCGLAVNDGSLYLTRSTLSPGGVVAGPGGSFQITGTSIENGWGVGAYGASGTITGCLIRGNDVGFRQDYDAGGIEVADSTVVDNSIVATSARRVAFAGCLIALNGRGGAIEPLFGNFDAPGIPLYDFDTCTIAQNGDGSARALFDYSGRSFVDSICWGNSPPTILLDPDIGADLHCSNSDVELPAPMAPCLNADPLFWDAAGGDFHLLPGSPAIGMGAFPFDPTYCGTPRVYCTAKVNSEGCTPSIAWTGAPSIAGPHNDFHITASNVLNNKNGILFWGTEDWGAPFQGGTLCVKPPIVRTGVQNSGGNPPPNDCSGAYDFHMSQAYMTQHLFQVGSTVYGQYWSRDPGFTPPNNVGLTDALRVVVCP